MSRIAGIVSQEAGAKIGPMLERQKVPGGQPHNTLGDQVALGFTGLSSGLIAERNGVRAVVDGVFYNAPDLGEGSDAEILISLYRQFGFEGALQRINGDFSVAIFDDSTGELWIGRDRFGIKPLYYSTSSDRFAFASRLSALLTLDWVTRQPNTQYVALVAASHYRHFDNQPESSPYRDIRQLPAATWLRYRAGQVQSGTYWSMQDLDDFDDSEENLAEQYRELILDATKIRLARTERPGFTLSGGMDSSTVICSAVAVSGEKQEAYSSVYSDKTYDESEDIATILDHAVTHWNQVDASDPDVFGLVEEMVAANDEPVATATWLSHYLVCKQASQDGVTHLFGGLGGDELNAGEYEHFFPFFADLIVSNSQDRLDREVEKWAEYHDHPLYPKDYARMEETVKRICDLENPGVISPDRERLEKYHSLLNPDFFDLTTFSPVMESPFRSYLKNRCFQDITRETSPCCLRAQDRQGMNFGIHHVMPFFDHRVVEFMFRIPSEMKFAEGVTKNLLRKATKGVIPDETRGRIKKTGWNAPAHLWFSGEGAEKLRDLVSSQWFKDLGIYRVDSVQSLLDEHLDIVENEKVQENHMMLFWQLLNLALWLKKDGQ